MDGFNEKISTIITLLTVRVKRQNKLLTVMKLLMLQPLTVYFSIYGAKHRKKSLTVMKLLTVQPLTVFCSIDGVNGLSNG